MKSNARAKKRTRRSTMKLHIHHIVWNANTVRRVLFWFVMRKWGAFIPLFRVREGVHRFIISDKKTVLSLQKEDMFRVSSVFAVLERCAERLILTWKMRIEEELGKFTGLKQMKVLGINPKWGLNHKETVADAAIYFQFHKYYVAQELFRTKNLLELYNKKKP